MVKELLTEFLSESVGNGFKKYFQKKKKLPQKSEYHNGTC